MVEPCFHPSLDSANEKQQMLAPTMDAICDCFDNTSLLSAVSYTKAGTIKDLMAEHLS